MMVTAHILKNYTQMGWEPIEDTHTKRESLAVFKALKGDLLEYILKKFKLKQNNQHHQRSNNCKLYLQKPKTDFMKKSFLYRGASTWNSLPSEVAKNYANLSKTNFKAAIANHFNNRERESSN